MTKRELKELIKECIIEHKQLTNEVQLDEGYKDILTAMAIAGAVLLSGKVGYDNIQLRNKWQKAYEQVKLSDPEKAERLKKLIAVHRFTSAKYFGRRKNAKDEIESIIDDFNEQMSDVHKKSINESTAIDAVAWGIFGGMAVLAASYVIQLLIIAYMSLSEKIQKLIHDFLFKYSVGPKIEAYCKRRANELRNDPAVQAALADKNHKGLWNAIRAKKTDEDDEMGELVRKYIGNKNLASFLAKAIKSNDDVGKVK